MNNLTAGSRYAPDNETSVAIASATPTHAELVGLLLADKRSPATRKAYAGDLRAFFGSSGSAPHPDEVRAFLSLPPPQIAVRLVRYKADMLGGGLAEATVNRRLAAVRSLLKLAFRMGMCATDGRSLVDGEKVRPYRDTRGVDLATLRRLIVLPGTDTLRGLRDTAILRLMGENALRRAEVCSLDVADFEPGTKVLQVTGKGRGSQKEPVTISAKSGAAIAAYLAEAGHQDGALFRNLDRRSKSTGLSVDGLYYVIKGYGDLLGVKLAPHRIRHSSITAALDETGGDVRAVQKLSRHSKLDTLMLYDDSREDRQGEVTQKLSKLL